MGSSVLTNVKGSIEGSRSKCSSRLEITQTSQTRVFLHEKKGKDIERTIKAVTLKTTLIAINRPRNLSGTAKKHATEAR